MWILPTFSPTMFALSLTSLVLLVSNVYQGGRKIAFQSFCFLSGLAAAMAYLIVRQQELVNLYAAFAALSRDARLALSIIVIVATYFGGAMYLGASSGSLTVVLLRKI
jgi:hypothetical protein